MSSSKNILIVMDQLACGGIEKSIITYLSEMPETDYEVTLMLYRRGGVFEKYVPEWVHLEDIPLTAFGRGMLEEGRKALALRHVKEEAVFKLIRLAGVALFGRFFVPTARRPLYYFRKSIDTENLDRRVYDVAIAYHNIEQALFVAAHVKARKKLTWFHTELSTLAFPPTVYDAIYRQFDGYVASSTAVYGELKKFFPGAGRKLKKSPYMVSLELCQRMASEYPPFDRKFDGLRLLSVGRLSKQKGFDIAIEVFDRLKAKGYQLEWTIIGEGSERASLEAMLRERKLEGFNLIGLKENPYPYFAECDIYAQPSRYEGYCITLAEARMFAKPSVVTDFAGAREQLRDSETGLVVPCDVSVIEAALERLIKERDLRTKFSDQLREENESRTAPLNAFKALLDECCQSPQ